MVPASLCVLCACLVGGEQPRDFTFDFSYWSFDSSAPNFATNPKVYSDLGVSVLNNAWAGYNCCLFGECSIQRARGSAFPRMFRQHIIRALLQHTTRTNIRRQA